MGATTGQRMSVTTCSPTQGQLDTEPVVQYVGCDALSHEAGPEELTATSPSLADLLARSDEGEDGVDGGVAGVSCSRHQAREAATRCSI